MITSEPMPVQKFLAQFSEKRRADGVYYALSQLKDRMEEEMLLVCELCFEVHRDQLWGEVSGGDFKDEADFYSQVLGISMRTAQKRIAVGRLVSGYSGDRADLRRALATMGYAKAAVIVPALESGGDLKEWERKAKIVDDDGLQMLVTAFVGKTPRGGAPGGAFLAYILGKMPSEEAREEVAQVFKVGFTLAETDSAVMVFLAMVAEVKSGWLSQVERGEAE